MRKYILLLLITLPACSSYKEILPGLCYSDKGESFTCMCPEEQRTWHGHCVDEEDIKPKPKLPETYPPGYLQCNKWNLIEYCEGRSNDLECVCINNIA